MRTIHNGSTGGFVKKLQRAINARLRTRDAPHLMVKVDGVFGPKTRWAMKRAAFLLGADRKMLQDIESGPISPVEQRFIRNPGRRDADERRRAKRRLAKHRKARAKAKRAKNSSNRKRQEIVRLAEKAAANYRKNPAAYHYLAGGVANLIYLSPSPRHYRSDCSQFVAAVYKDAGLPTPGSVPHLWISTFTMVKASSVRFVDKRNRKPGMLGMYGSRSAPYHVEIWCSNKFIGHGSQPIDSVTPGEPDYYIDFDFLN